MGVHWSRHDELPNPLLLLLERKGQANIVHLIADLLRGGLKNMTTLAHEMR
jgi:hypothetical protein